MATTWPLAVGPLRLLVESPGDWKPTPSAPTVSSRFHAQETPYRATAPFTIRGDVDLNAPLLQEPDEPVAKTEGVVTGDVTAIQIEYPGSISRCDLVDRSITIDVPPGGRATIPGRFLASLLLPGMDCLAVHAAGIVIDGKGYVLPGQSEAGKTTSSRFAHAAGLRVLNDDTVVLGWSDDGQPVVWGTTFHGDAQLADPGPVPLAGLYFLHQSASDRVEPLDQVQGAKNLLLNAFPVISSLPPAAAKPMVLQLLGLAHRICASVPSHRLCFRPTPAFLELLS